MWRAGGYGGLSGPFNVYNIGGAPPASLLDIAQLAAASLPEEPARPS